MILGLTTGASVIGVIIARVEGVLGYQHVFLYMSVMLGLIFIATFFLKSQAEENSTRLLG